MLKTFIDRINPEHKNKLEYTLEKLKGKIFNNQSVDVEGNILIDEHNDSLVEDSGITHIEVFRYFT